MHMIPTAESRYNQWVREHYRLSLRSACALTGSRVLAQDVAQDCFTSAWEHRKQLRDPAMARAWLFQIMRRHAFRHMVPQSVALDDTSEWHDHAPSHTDALNDQLDVVKALALDPGQPPQPLLRGSCMESTLLLQHLGLDHRQTVPGYAQLMRPCDIDGHLTYHLTTFFDKGGMVTVFAFKDAVALPIRSGWWGNVYGQVVDSRDGRPLLRVAQKKKSLAVAQVALASPLP